MLGVDSTIKADMVGFGYMLLDFFSFGRRRDIQMVVCNTLVALDTDEHNHSIAIAKANYHPVH